jgi:hypothetical protein
MAFLGYPILGDMKYKHRRKDDIEAQVVGKVEEHLAPVQQYSSQLKQQQQYRLHLKQQQQYSLQMKQQQQQQQDLNQGQEALDQQQQQQSNEVTEHWELPAAVAQYNLPHQEAADSMEPQLLLQQQQQQQHEQQRQHQGQQQQEQQGQQQQQHQGQQQQQHQGQQQQEQQEQQQQQQQQQQEQQEQQQQQEQQEQQQQQEQQEQQQRVLITLAAAAAPSKHQLDDSSPLEALEHKRLRSEAVAVAVAAVGFNGKSQHSKACRGRTASKVQVRGNYAEATGTTAAAAAAVSAAAAGIDGTIEGIGGRPFDTAGEECFRDAEIDGFSGSEAEEVEGVGSGITGGHGFEVDDALQETLQETLSDGSAVAMCLWAVQLQFVHPATKDVVDVRIDHAGIMYGDLCEKEERWASEGREQQ